MPPRSFPEGVNISPSPSVLSLGLFFCNSVFSLKQHSALCRSEGCWKAPERIRRREHSRLTHTCTAKACDATADRFSHSAHLIIHPSLCLYLSIQGVWRTNVESLQPIKPAWLVASSDFSYRVVQYWDLTTGGRLLLEDQFSNRQGHSAWSAFSVVGRVVGGLARYTDDA